MDTRTPNTQTLQDTTLNKNGTLVPAKIVWAAVSTSGSHQAANCLVDPNLTWSFLWIWPGGTGHGLPGRSEAPHAPPGSARVLSETFRAEGRAAAGESQLCRELRGLFLSLIHI